MWSGDKMRNLPSVCDCISPGYFNNDCPQSSRRGSVSSGGPSSGSASGESSSSCNRCCEISSNSSSGGKVRFVRAKYGMTRKAAMGLSNTEPSSSAIIYAPPLLREMTMRGPRSWTYFSIECLFYGSVAN